MTREQAIAIIQQECLCVDRDCNIEKNCGNCDLALPSKEPILEAYKMAIEALEQEQCEDVISRQAVLSMQYRIDDSATLSTRDVVNVDDIEDLPSVKPVEKQEYCADAIDRQAAIDAFNAFEEESNQDTDIHEAIEIVLNLPSVTLPEPYKVSLTGLDGSEE